MKLLKIDENKVFICEECGVKCQKSDNLSRHIGIKHDKEDYYKKYIYEEGDDSCQQCGKKLNNKITFSIYNKPKFCSSKCRNTHHSEMILNYSEDKKEIIEKRRKQTCIEKYGVDNPVKDRNIRKKIQKTCIEKYGVDNYFSTDKFKDSLMENMYRKTIFKNTNLHYQSSYELDFLEKFYDKFSIKNGPTLNYKYEGIQKRYYPDFFIEKLNMIIEIKSLYTYKKELGQNIQKRKYSIKNGYNFMFVIDKNYSKLEEYVK